MSINPARTTAGNQEIAPATVKRMRVPKGASERYADWHWQAHQIATYSAKSIEGREDREDRAAREKRKRARALADGVVVEPIPLDFIRVSGCQDPRINGDVVSDRPGLGAAADVLVAGKKGLIAGLGRSGEADLAECLVVEALAVRTDDRAPAYCSRRTGSTPVVPGASLVSGSRKARRSFRAAHRSARISPGLDQASKCLE